jgi:hypothetical protein
VLLNSNVKNGYLQYGRRHTADSPRINEHVTEGEMRMFVHKLAKLKVTFDIYTHTHYDYHVHVLVTSRMKGEKFRLKGASIKRFAQHVHKPCVLVICDVCQ